MRKFANDGGELLSLYREWRRYRLVGARGVRGQQLQVGRVIENLVNLIVIAAEVGRDGREDESFGEVETSEGGQEGVERAIFGDTGSDRVGHGDGSGADTLHEPGNAGGFTGGGKDDGIDMGVVESAIDNIHAFEAGDGLKKHVVVDHEEIITLGEAKTHFTGEERMFGIKRKTRAGGQEYHRRLSVRRRRQSLQGVNELEGVVDD